MKFLNRFRAPKPTFSAALTPDEPFFAVGDVHGCDRLLFELLARMEARAPGLRRVFVGDYIDRGEESAAVLNRLRALQAEDPRVVCLAGNHELMLLSFLDKPARSGARWQRYGGMQCLASYGLAPLPETAPKADWEALRDRLRTAMGAATERWLRSLPGMWQSGKVLVVHAAADPTLPVQMQSAEVLAWGHPEFETTPRNDGIWVVHGHTITDSPQPDMGRIPTDTGAYATGRLTAALIEPDRVEFVHT